MTTRVRAISPAELRAEFVSKPQGHELRYIGILQLDLHSSKEARTDHFRRSTKGYKSVIKRHKSPWTYRTQITRRQTLACEVREAMKMIIYL